MLPCPHQTFLDCRFGRLEALRDFPNAVLLKIIQNNAGPLILLQPHDAFIQFRILSVPTYVFRFPAFFLIFLPSYDLLILSYDLMTFVDQNSYKPCFRILIIAQAVQILKCMHDRILNRVSTIRISSFWRSGTSFPGSKSQVHQRLLSSCVSLPSLRSFIFCMSIHLLDDLGHGKVPCLFFFQ